MIGANVERNKVYVILELSQTFAFCEVKVVLVATYATKWAESRHLW